MHYFVLATIPAGSTRFDAMSPVGSKVAGISDWFQIGGRHTGWFDDDYDPEKDPRNIKPCTICNATGERPGGREQFGDAWYERTNGCNGCNGTGQAVEWPTQWVPFPGDLFPASELVARIEERGIEYYEGDDAPSYLPYYFVRNNRRADRITHPDDGPEAIVEAIKRAAKDGLWLAVVDAHM